MNNRWAVVEVECTDGVTRVGLAGDHEVKEDNPKVFLMGLPGYIAERTAIRYAEKKGLELFNGEIHDQNDF